VPNPTLADSFTVDNFLLRTFSSMIVPVQSAYTLYIRAYATNTTGTAYGNEQVVVCTGVNMPAETYERMSITKVIPFSLKVPFNNSLTIAQTLQAAPYELSPLFEVDDDNENENPIPGSRAIYRLYGANAITPTFAAPFKATKDSAVFDVANLNIVEFLYDGVDFWYTIKLTV
jgi:hypothetical protein